MLANIPATQTVIAISEPGGPEVLVPATRPVPEPMAGEVLIRIAAGGVNRADCLQRMGRYPMPPGAPDIPGLECSGIVVKCGDGVTQWQDGDQVCALMIGDGYGEYAAVPAVQCLPVPPNVSLVDAGGLPGDILHRVDQRVRTDAPAAGRDLPDPGRLQRHRRHLDPARQGVGLQGAGHRRLGREVRSLPGVRRRCRRSTTAPRTSSRSARSSPADAGVDAILDMVGGDYIPRQIELLAQEGRLCFVALIGGTRVEADFGAIQRKHLTVTGSTLRSRSVAQKAGIIAALREKVWPLWAQHKLRPFTWRQFPLREAAAAHRLMELASTSARSCWCPDQIPNRHGRPSLRAQGSNLHRVGDCFAALLLAMTTCSFLVLRWRRIC